MIDKTIFRKEVENTSEIASKNFEWCANGIVGLFYQATIELSTLPYKAYILTLSICKAIYRMYK